LASCKCSRRCPPRVRRSSRSSTWPRSRSTTPGSRYDLDGADPGQRRAPRGAVGTRRHVYQ
jgi:hypothetical protein